MVELPKKLQKKLTDRVESNALRKLNTSEGLVDFSSNDYLGFAQNKSIHDSALNIIAEEEKIQNGATGSRLLSGNHPLYEKLEAKLSEFFEVESALVFNSGYDANLGFFSSVPQRGDIVFYDELIHASIRDGMRLSRAKFVKFKHNDLTDLEKQCRTEEGSSPSDFETYIVTESVFSMDGDSPDLKSMVEFCKKNSYNLIVDEAHAIGVFGKNGRGLVQELGLQNQVFSRIITFGKALGCHGAAVLGSNALKSYLVNFARSLIYTTGLPPHAVASVIAATELFASSTEFQDKLHKNIVHFNNELSRLKLNGRFVPSITAVHCCIVPGNEIVVSIAKKLQNKGFHVMPIRYPSVRAGQERLRFCIHSFNTQEEISRLLELLAKFI